MSGDVKVTIPEDEKRNHSPKKSPQVKRISKYVSEFMNNSSIHGLKYLVGTDRTIFEKILWFTVLLVSIYTCSLLIKSTWQKWEENPVFIGFSQTPVRLWEIPFPAVTICLGYSLNKRSNLTFSYITDEKEWRMGNVSTFCDSNHSNNSSYYTEFEMVDFCEGSKWEKFLTETAILPEQIFWFCAWNWEQNCKNLFAPIFTEWGICFSFNMLDRKDLFRDVTYLPFSFANQRNISHWTFDKNYPESKESIYPRRSETVRDKLQINLSSYLDKVACRGINKYLIILHHPGEVPSVNRGFEIENNKSHDIWIKPRIVVTSDSLRSCLPKRKKCFFPEDRYLYFYKIYTAENCERECLANYTLRRCGCVSYYLPHKKTTKLCARWNVTNSECMQKSQELMLQSESGIIKNRSNFPLCNCLPSCNLITYDVDLKVTDSSEVTGIAVRFKDTEFIVLERQELFGDVNFWASCGGIIGLFTGFSVVSLAEIVYYLLFRGMYNVGRRLWHELNPNRFMFEVFK